MTEVSQERDQNRQLLSRLARGWVKLSKFTLEEFAQRTNINRSNLFYQIAEPETAKRMGVKSLRTAAAVAGIRADEDGNWTVFDGRTQIWRWSDATEQDKEVIFEFLIDLYQHLNPKKQFSVTRLHTVQNDYYKLDLQHALVEIRDSQDNTLSCILIAEDEANLIDAYSVLRKSGVFKTEPDQQIPPDQALQWTNGPGPRPFVKDEPQQIDWNPWMELVVALNKRGIRPEDIAKLAGLSIKSEQTLIAPGHEDSVAESNKNWCF